MQQSKTQSDYTTKYSLEQLDAMRDKWIKYHEQLNIAHSEISLIHQYFYFLYEVEKWPFEKIAHYFDRTRQRISQIVDRVRKEVKTS